MCVRERARTEPIWATVLYEALTCAQVKPAPGAALSGRLWLAESRWGRGRGRRGLLCGALVLTLCGLGDVY